MGLRLHGTFCTDDGMPDSTRQGGRRPSRNGKRLQRGAPKLPRNHAEVIGLWPSLQAYAAETGINVGMAKQQRRRGRIGDEYRPRVVRAAKQRGFHGVTFELLSLTAAPRRNAVPGAEARP